MLWALDDDAAEPLFRQAALDLELTGEEVTSFEQPHTHRQPTYF
jgi:hypothetical protein